MASYVSSDTTLDFVDALKEPIYLLFANWEFLFFAPGLNTRPYLLHKIRYVPLHISGPLKCREVATLNSRVLVRVFNAGGAWLTSRMMCIPSHVPGGIPNSL